jgi:hypothetical protein
MTDRLIVRRGYILDILIVNGGEGDSFIVTYEVRLYSTTSSALTEACHEIYTKKACKKINRFVCILTDFGIGSLVIIIYIEHYFLPIAYVIFILTQRLVPVAQVRAIIVKLFFFNLLVFNSRT